MTGVKVSVFTKAYVG